jgi:hypothetical protein
MFVRITYLKRDDADQDATDEKSECDDEPDDTPHFFCESVKKGAGDQHVIAQKKDGSITL